MSLSARPLNGRPFRFVGIILGVWILGRVLAYHPVWPDHLPPARPTQTNAQLAHALAPQAFEAQGDSTAPNPSHFDPAAFHPINTSNKPLIPNHWQKPNWAKGTTPLIRKEPAKTGLMPYPLSPADAPTVPNQPPATSSLTHPHSAATSSSMPKPRAYLWSASMWIAWRDRASGAGLSSNGQLGASQIGGRIDRKLVSNATASIALYSRASAAMDQPHDGEIAMGLSLRTHILLPSTIGIERRLNLKPGKRDAMAIVATTGFGPTNFGPNVIAEGYGQAGVVGFERQDAFVDGRLTVTHPLGSSGISAGVALSGGAQPHVSRMDIGPVIEARLPLGDAKPRLSLEWKERIGGNANPGSGVALTLAADF
jgi:hypothetical protein